MKRSIPPNWRLEFKGSSEPFIVPKIVSTTPRTLTRQGITLIGAMQGYAYFYYIKSIGVPIEKRCMSMSICVTGLTQQIYHAFQREDQDDEDKAFLKTIWMFYRDPNTKEISVVRLNKKPLLP